MAGNREGRKGKKGHWGETESELFEWTEKRRRSQRRNGKGIICVQKKWMKGR